MNPETSVESPYLIERTLDIIEWAHDIALV